MRWLPVLLLAACAPKSDLPKYDNTLFQLASGYSAKLMCSCLFVMEQDEPFCADWTRVSPEVARYRIDQQTKTVSSRSLGMGKTVAQYVDDHVGCRIVEE